MDNNNNNSIGFVLYPEQSAFIWKASWISLFAALYALNVGHYDLCLCLYLIYIIFIF